MLFTLAKCGLRAGDDWCHHCGDKVPDRPNLTLRRTERGNTNLVPPSPAKIQMIAGIYLACMAGAVVMVSVGVDSLTRYSKDRSSASGKSGVQLLAVTLRQLRHKYQLLLLPVIGFIGAEQAFMAADFTQVTQI
ncbi:UNC93-like protein [Eumeta japonica]|uniref:UNC93-like protein n=1 Tax=Eumeta variegata TaxID=151549 RepID=A0A4C1Y7B5_EUMVA|nr:UNC93-like protein [Eumeta japonica]